MNLILIVLFFKLMVYNIQVWFIVKPKNYLRKICGGVYGKSNDS